MLWGFELRVYDMILQDPMRCRVHGFLGCQCVRLSSISSSLGLVEDHSRLDMGTLMSGKVTFWL